MIQEEVFSRTETKKKIMRYRLRVKRSAQSPSLSDSKGGKAANDHPALQLQSHPGLEEETEFCHSSEAQTQLCTGLGLHFSQWLKFQHLS